MVLPLAVGDRATFRKTVGESDVYLFAGITGDLSPNHVDEVAMEGSPYGRRIAHGALIVGYMSAASTKILAHLDPTRAEGHACLGGLRPHTLSEARIHWRHNRGELSSESN
jgi:3-hydroxybutyryl-CoA dehydratase